MTKVNERERRAGFSPRAHPSGLKMVLWFSEITFGKRPKMSVTGVQVLVFIER